jgi:hypothetical protein
MIPAMIVIGVVTVFGVVIIAVIETRRMEKGKPSILSRATKERGNKTQKGK